jgi:hypothetical protein
MRIDAEGEAVLAGLLDDALEVVEVLLRRRRRGPSA